MKTSKLSLSNIFKAAHALTKATVKASDSYSATFVICLKVIYAENIASELQGFKIIESMVVEVSINGGAAKKMNIIAGSNYLYLISRATGKEVCITNFENDVISFQNTSGEMKLTNNTCNDLFETFYKCYTSLNDRKLKVINKGAKVATATDKKDGKVFTVNNNTRVCYAYA